MLVKIAIVGLRSYYREGETGLADVYKRVPVGTMVYLRRHGDGEPYPGSIEVMDDDGLTIGFVSMPDIRRIDSMVEGGRLLPVTISEHCPKDKCMYVKYENTRGISVPDIREVALMDGETAFPYTKHDLKVMKLSQMMRAKIDALKEAERNVHRQQGESQNATVVQIESQNVTPLPSPQRGVQNVHPLLKTSKEYLEYCCTSMDGDTFFSRDDILHDLLLLAETYPELQEVHDAIFARKKDLGRVQGDVKPVVYRAQYNRIKEQAARKGSNGLSLLDEYSNRLAFRNGGTLTAEAIDREIRTLSERLAEAMDGRFVDVKDNDNAFADMVYSLNYSMQSLYRIYSRRIRLEWLQEQRAAMASRETLYPNQVSGQTTAPNQCTGSAAPNQEHSSTATLNQGSGSDESPKQVPIPPELNTPEAQRLWSIAKKHGWVTENLQPTLKQNRCSILADEISARLDLSPRWKAIEGFWGIKNMSAKLYSALKSDYYENLQKDIREAFDG